MAIFCPFKKANATAKGQYLFSTSSGKNRGKLVKYV